MGASPSTDNNNTSTNNKSRKGAFLPGDLVQLVLSNNDNTQQQQQHHNNLYQHTFVITSVQQEIQQSPLSPASHYYHQLSHVPPPPSSSSTTLNIYPSISGTSPTTTTTSPMNYPHSPHYYPYSPQHHQHHSHHQPFPQYHNRFANMNFQAPQQDCITIQSVIDHRVLYCHPNAIRLIPDNIPNKRRRIEYALIQEYVQACKRTSQQPLNSILDLYSEHIRKGEPVTVLDLSQRSIMDAQLYPIMQLLKTGSAVRRLYLSYNRLSEYGCLCIGEHLGKLKSLRELDLSYNFLNVTAAKHLAKGLKVNKSLNLLNLNHTNLTSDGCDYILQALLANPNCTIIKLDLRYNNVADTQIATLLQIAKKHKCFSFVQVYPAKSKSYPTLTEYNNLTTTTTTTTTNEEEEDQGGWLSYEGWVNYSNLNALLAENAQFLKENPSWLKQISTKSEETSDELLRYFVDKLSVHDFISPLLSSTTTNTATMKKKTPVDGDWIVLNGENSTPMSPFPDNLTFDPDLLSIYNRNNLSSRRVHTEQQQQQQQHQQQQQQQQQEEENEVMIECKICLDDTKASNIYILDCDHKFCLQCLQQYISVKINNGEVDSIKCPDCKRPLSVTEIKQLSQNLQSEVNGADRKKQQRQQQQQQNLFDKFDRISLQKALSQMGDLVYCPNASCGNAMIVNEKTTQETTQKIENRRSQNTASDESISTESASTTPPISPQIIEDALMKRVVCTHCRHQFCRKCKKKWHAGLSCEENEEKQKDEQEEQFKQWMTETGNVKSCPKCNITILKHRGCNSMKCGNCQQHFCWFCGEMFNGEDEKKHFKNCNRWSFWGINISLY
jgi:hypothetical protein